MHLCAVDVKSRLHFHDINSGGMMFKDYISTECYSTGNSAEFFIYKCKNGLVIFCKHLQA